MRIEHDFLGEIKIPDEIYYGVQTTRAVDNFVITGHKLHDDFIKSFGIVKAAAAKANMKTGRMPSKIGNAIVQAAEEIANGKFHDQFVVDCIQGGAGTSMNMNANEVIANRALEILGEKKGNYSLISPNNHVNMAQSTNDVVPTAMRICTITKAKKLITALEELAAAFTEKGDEFSHVLKMGRTHLQDAVPITLGQEFYAYGEAVKRGIKRIRENTMNMHYVNMGATAVGTGINADTKYVEDVVRILSEVTNVDFVQADDLVDGTRNLDSFVWLSSALKVAAVNSIKSMNR